MKISKPPPFSRIPRNVYDLQGCFPKHDAAEGCKDYSIFGVCSRPKFLFRSECPLGPLEFFFWRVSLPFAGMRNHISATFVPFAVRSQFYFSPEVSFYQRPRTFSAIHLLVFRKSFCTRVRVALPSRQVYHGNPLAARSISL